MQTLASVANAGLGFVYPLVFCDRVDGLFRQLRQPSVHVHCGAQFYSNIS
jgi:hypothetical protein